MDTFGVSRLGLHFSWFLIALLITVSLGQQFGTTNPDWGATVAWATAVITGLLFFAALFAHELSHALVARMRGLPIHKITLFLLGGIAQIEKEADDPGTEFWVAIAGPIMSTMVGLVCLGGALAIGWVPQAPPARPVTAVLVWLGYINLMLAAFNMIPGFPLDGGRVLRAILWSINHDERRATRIASRVGQLIAMLFIVWGIYRFFLGAGLGGLWLAFIGWFLMQAASASYAQVQASTALRGVLAGEVMSRDCEAVNADTTLADFVHGKLLATGRRCFLVTRGHEMIGMITPHQVREIPKERWDELRVADVMLPMDRIHAVTPETPVLEALELMGREDINQVPVVANGHIEGVLSRADLLQVLQSRQELAA